MIFQGSFNDKNNQSTYRVIIGDTGATTTITDPTEYDWEHAAATDNIVMFAPNPVVVAFDNTDSFSNRIIKTSCTIRLVTNMDMSKYLSPNTYNDIPVKIELKYDDYYLMVWYGYVAYGSFSQEYANNFNVYDVNCIDQLSTLQYIKVNELRDSNNLPLTGLKTWHEILQGVFNAIKWEEYQSPINDIRYYYDGGATDKDNTTLWKLVFNCNLFWGESEDDWMTAEEILNEILKVFNVWSFITLLNDQYGDRMIVNRNMLSRTFWHSYFNYTFPSGYNAVSDDMQIGLEPAYGIIKRECKITEPEELVNPFDDETLTSPFHNIQKYMTEYAVKGGGTILSTYALQALNDFVYTDDIDKTATYYDIIKDFSKYENFVWVKESSIFNTRTSLKNMVNWRTAGLYEAGHHQEEVLNYLKNNRYQAAFITFGRTPNLIAPNNDDSVVGENISTTDYLVISVNGHSDQSDNGHINVMTTELSQCVEHPVLTMTHSQSNIFTPSDTNTTNYLVISGNIKLNPLQPKSGRSDGGSDYANTINDHTYSQAYNDLHDATQEGPYFMNGGGYPRGYWKQQTVEYGKNDECLYTQKFFACEESSSNIYTVIDDGQIGDTAKNANILTFGDLDNEKGYLLKYNYSEAWNETDQVSKLPVLECEMMIGNKYCVETDENVFEWMTYDQCPTVYDADSQTYVKHTTFTIGINPKIGDYIIGQKHDILNNIDYTMGIDAKGMAIPIKASDNLFGEFSFKILGPVNIIWNEVTKSVHRRCLFWRKTNWYSTNWYVLEMLENILVENLKITLESDYGYIKNGKDNNDLVYQKKTLLNADEKGDEVMFNSCLTSSEASLMKVTQKLTQSFILYYDQQTGEYTPFYGFVNGMSVVKPEEIFCQEMNMEWGSPKRTYTFTFDLNEISNDEYGCCLTPLLYGYWIFPNESNKFIATAAELDIHSHYVNATFKEINPLFTNI